MAGEQALLERADFALGGRKDGEKDRAFMRNFMDMVHKILRKRPVIFAENKGREKFIVLQ
jgi:hypothetical protein